MSKPAPKAVATHVPKYRTPAQVKADAQVLAGRQSLVARAATEDDAPPSPQEAGSVGELWLYGLVGGWWFGFTAESVANALRGLDVDTLYVRVHSPGGRASDGVAIGNLLRNHKAHVVVVVDGLAASAASVIAIAGDEVVMCPGSQMMLHDASTGIYGNEAELRRAADWIGGQSRNYAGVYAHKAGGTPEQWREVMLANDGWGTWYTADDAVTAGLADEVGTRIASGSPPTAPDEQIDEDDDDMVAKVAHDLALLSNDVHPAARAAWQGERPKPPSAGPRSGQPTTEGGPAVAFSDAQLTTMRDKLGLPETADEAAILAAVEAVVDESLEERPASAGLPEGHVAVPQAKLADLEAGATAGRKAAEKLHAMERDAFLDANRNKFARDNRDAWAKEYDRDPEGTRKHFASAPVLIPDAELGHEIDADDEQATGDEVATVRESDAYKNWEM